MSDTLNTTVQEFVFRRAPSLVPFFRKGTALDRDDLWVLLPAGAVFLLALFYVGWMYYRDSRSVGPWWASFLGLLRGTVWGFLAFVFLLPATQNYDRSVTRSKAVLLFDTSLSMIDTRDDPPIEGQDPLKLPTRQDKVLAFLKNDKIEFMKRLTDVNTITAYRFGSNLDEGPYQFADGRFFNKAEWEDLARHPEKRRDLPPEMAMPNEFWAAWLKPSAHLRPPDDWDKIKKDEFVKSNYLPPADWDEKRKAAFVKPLIKDGDDWSETDRERFAELARYNTRMHLEKGLFDGTNLYQSLSDTLAREQNNLTRTIVLVSDGRSHLGSPEAIEDIKRKAKEKKIPIIVIGIGSTRPKARIEVADVRHPKQIQPDDSFRVVAEIKGEGLPPEYPIDVLLEVTKVKTVEAIKDGMPVKIETKQDITVVEQRPPKKRNPDEKPKEDEKEPPLEEVKLGQTLVLKPAQQPKFDNSPRPRTAVEFQIEAAILAQVAAKTPEEDLATVMKNKSLSVALASLKGKSDDERKEFERKFEKIKKWGLGETAKDEEYRFRVVVPTKHPLDTTPGRDHLEKTGGIRVLKKPLSVLIFTSSASKDYQFLRELLIRETQKDLARLTLVFQTTDAKDSTHPIGVVHGVPERRLADRVPDRLSARQGEQQTRVGRGDQRPGVLRRDRGPRSRLDAPDGTERQEHCQVGRERRRPDRPGRPALHQAPGPARRLQDQAATDHRRAAGHPQGHRRGRGGPQAGPAVGPGVHRGHAGAGVPTADRRTDVEGAVPRGLAGDVRPQP